MLGFPAHSYPHIRTTESWRVKCAKVDLTNSDKAKRHQRHFGSDNMLGGPPRLLSLLIESPTNGSKNARGHTLLRGDTFVRIFCVVLAFHSNFFFPISVKSCCHRETCSSAPTIRVVVPSSSLPFLFIYFSFSCRVSILLSIHHRLFHPHFSFPSICVEFSPAGCAVLIPTSGNSNFVTTSGFPRNQLPYDNPINKSIRTSISPASASIFSKGWDSAAPAQSA